MKDKTGYTDRDSIIRIALIALTFALLSGCAASNVKDVLTNLQGCTRHYAGAVGGVAAGALTFQIDCVPPKTETPTVVAPAPAQ